MKIFPKISAWILASLPLTSASAQPAAGADDLFLSSELVEEVVSTSKDPYAFDWRRMSLELEVGYDYVDEANNFDNDGASLLIGVPVSDEVVARFGFRRYWVYRTRSSDLVGRTPFKQAARSNRYEIPLEVDYVLLQGRSITPLSPLISDGEHVLYATGGMHYAHENRGNIPSRDDPPEPMPGQEPVRSKFALELGLRWHLYLPSSFGIFFVAQRQIPTGDTAELRHWTHFGGGLLWAFGVE